MVIKVIILFMLLVAGIVLLRPAPVIAKSISVRVDKAWWEELSEEWKTILLINQNFQNQGVDIFRLQEEYINRLNQTGEANYAEINRSLYDLNDFQPDEAGN